MGRRSINTTKSGKYMNPTDQARKEARKRELKKNKKQRMMVRMAVLKGKDPMKLIEEMDVIDEMEYDLTAPPKLSERVLKDKRKKLKETFDRVMRMYQKEDPEYASEMRKKEIEYNKRRTERIIFYEQVKNAQQVELDQIPLPDMPSSQPLPAQIPLPSDIPLPFPGAIFDEDMQPKSILKKTAAFTRPTDTPEFHVPPIRIRKRKPPGPPPGTPPSLSDSDSDDDRRYDRVPPPSGDSSTIPPPPGIEDIEIPPALKQRKIRFEDDSDQKSDDPEKDTRQKYSGKPSQVSALQMKMLRMAGQQLPGSKARDSDSDRERDSDREDRRRRRRDDDHDRRRRRRRGSTSSESSSDSEGESSSKKTRQETSKPATSTPATSTAATTPTPSMPPGPPPGLPPGPPPGLPPMMLRPPPLRPPGSVPRMLPPGPPPGRPPGLPPGPPPGLPPNMRNMAPRLPPGPPGVPPPRLLRPPGAPPGLPPPGSIPSSSAAAASGTSSVATAANPSILSAPPSILKPSGGHPDAHGARDKNTATIIAKPQIKNVIGDVTRFMPTSLRVKREIKDSKGRIIRTSGYPEEKTTVQSNPTVHAQTKDDAYDTFMKEMEGLL